MTTTTARFRGRARLRNSATRLRVALVPVFVLAGLTLGILAAVPAQAAPAAVGPADASYYPLHDQQVYTSLYNATLNNIIHVDTEHATNDGFWFAIAANGIDDQARDMAWIYQPYGAKCLGIRDLTFNPWLNTYGCLINADRAEAQSPAAQYKATTANCQASLGRPWSYGYIENGTNCYNTNISAIDRNIETAPTEGFDCAPWEDQSLNPQGRARCLNQSYPYIANPEADPWNPDPDVCTGAPAGANTFLVAYNANSVAASNVPDCTGVGNAPNCTGATTGHAACGGTILTGQPQNPGGPVRGSATITAVAAGQALSATETRTATDSDRKGTAKATYRERYDGRLFQATGDAPIIAKGQATRSRTVNGSTAQTQATVTQTCDRSTLAEAHACAQPQAASQAQGSANAAQATAKTILLASLSNQAASGANADAKAAAKAETKGAASKAEKNRAERKAQAEAKRKVNRAIKRYQNTGRVASGDVG